MKTNLSVQGDKFLINGQLTYSEIPTVKPEAKGLLMNARFIQGIFNDVRDPERFNRFGRTWDPEQNTKDLIAALPEWYRYGLRAFTVGFQGGGPCFTIRNNKKVENNPFSPDGKTIDQSALDRMKDIVMAADELGMVVIVSFFYSGQIHFFDDDDAVKSAAILVAEWAKEEAFTNVILEIANENNCIEYKPYDSIRTDEGLCELIAEVREASGGMLVGCSALGFAYFEKVALASDVNIIHGNNQSRQLLYNKIIKAKETKLPILCNEDSQALSRLGVTFPTQVSWGYYNNLTKQEPPVNWGIQKGEDLFFAYRMAMGIGIEVPQLKEEEQFYLQGLEPEITYAGERWIRLASLYPECIDHVDFYCNDELVYVAYDDPFLVYYEKTWDQAGVKTVKGDVWKAEIFLASGEKRIIEKSVI